MHLKTLLRILVRGTSLALAMTLGLGLSLNVGPIPVAHAAAFTVNSTGDAPDINPGDGICDIDDTDFGITCTLRAAIEEANASPGADVIDFDVPGSTLVTIQPSSALPTITDPVTIDGTSGQLHRVVLDGVNAGQGVVGLRITAGNSTVRGLDIVRFGSDGIVLTTNGGNVIAYNRIGTTFYNIPNMGNGGYGIFIDNSSSNTIGGTTFTDRNVISGNGLEGIHISGSDSTGNQISGNYIGTNTSGVVAVGNGGGGVVIFSSPNNTIGGTTAGARNVISGNKYHGIEIDGPAATGTTVKNNFIGTDVHGSTVLGNSYDGVLILDSPNNTIGGTTTSARNLISGNGQAGIEFAGSRATGNIVQGNLIGTNITGAVALGNYSGVLIQGAGNNIIGGTATGAGNVISGNNLHGVEITGYAATGNQVLGNYIGTNITGMAALGNKWDGVYIEAAPNNIIGGIAAGAGNIISGNERNGVTLVRGATGNQVRGNYIGTDATGMGDALLNVRDRVLIDSAPGNIIGGTETGARNVISGNWLHGVEMTGTAASGNRLQGNLIGPDVTGRAVLTNTNWIGVIVNNAPNNIIGGTEAGAGNIISGNGWEGITISGAGAAENTVQGNFIGTDITGTAALGNGRDGVRILDAPNNIIGGTETRARNVISANKHYGINIDWDKSGATGNQVLGNWIGASVSGDALGNAWAGVLVLAPSNSNTTLGGTVAGAGNIIAYNGREAAGYPNAGIYVIAGTSVAISRNSIFRNAGLGIDLYPDGVNPNDAGDGDEGPNNLQNFPVLISAVSAVYGGGWHLTVQGMLNSTPNTAFTLEFFDTSECDPSGSGEGNIFIGAKTVTTGSDSNVSFTATFTSSATDFVTATATDPDNNTSEFSQCVKVVYMPLHFVYLPLVVK